jgi:hypothetical protein
MQVPSVRGERAVLIIGGVSLVTAVVCFGILKSTGSFDNSYYSVGGAFVGFLLSTVTLKRIYIDAERSLVSPAQRKSASFIFEEVVKVADFRSTGSPADKDRHSQLVTITDYYRLTKGTGSSILNFHYATTGKQITGICVSHPGSYKWID